MKRLQKFDIYDGNPAIISNEYEYKRASRWIKIENSYNVNKRNALYDYSVDGNGYHPYQDSYNPENGTFLDFFRWGGRKYAIEQFAAFGSIMDTLGHFTGYIENGEQHFLAGYDVENYFNPIIIETDEYGEYVRVYEEVKRGW